MPTPDRPHARDGVRWLSQICSRSDLASCHSSAREATVLKHIGQMESTVPSSFFLWGKVELSRSVTCSLCSGLVSGPLPPYRTIKIGPGVRA
jgi:hypothetical protein